MKIFGPSFQERVSQFPEIALWHPASGHPGGWRVVRETATGLQELEGASGKRILFKSLAAADLRAAQLNSKP